MPSDNLVDEAVAAMTGQAEVAYFFDNLTSPSWIGPLARKGLFADPTPAEYEGKWVTYPAWPQSRYLARMASLDSSGVADVVVALPETDNARVRHDIIEAAESMHGPDAVRVAERIVSWLENGVPLLLPGDVANVVLRLIREGELSAAVRLGRALLRVEVDDQRTLGVRSSLPGMSGWDFQHAVDTILEGFATLELGREELEPWLIVFADQLQAAVEAVSGEDRPVDRSWLWRPSIAPDEQNRSYEEIFNALVNAVRDIAMKIADIDVAHLAFVVQELERREWAIFRRLALHILREKGHATALARTRALDTAAMSTLDIHTEYWRLVAVVAPAFDETDETKLLAELRRIAAERSEGDDARAKQWALRCLTILEDPRPEKLQAAYSLLVEQLGYVPVHPEFLSHITSGFSGPNSPLSRETLSCMPVSDIASYLATWTPEGGWDAPSVSGLAYELQQVVASEPNRFIDDLGLFLDVPAAYQLAVVSGVRSAILTEMEVPWPALLKWCAQLVAPTQKMDLDLAQSDVETSREHVRRGVAHLIETVLTPDGSTPTTDCDAALWEVLKPLTLDPEPAPNVDAGNGDTTDPSTRALNTTRGTAMHAVVRFALWQREQSGAEVLSPGVRDVLDVHLDPAIDPSPAIRSVYGQWFPWLCLVDEAWAAENVNAIFGTQARDDLGLAAWTSYITYCNPFDSVFAILKGHYMWAVEALSDSPVDETEDTPRRDQPSNRLAEHLAILLLRGQVALGDALLRTFFKEASVGVRAQFLLEAGRAVSTLEEPSEVTERAQQLLEVRLTALRDSALDPGELKAFGWWMGATALPADWRLRSVISVLHLANGLDRAHAAFVAIAELASELPSLAVDATQLLVLADSSGWDITGSVDAIARTLQCGIDSNDSADRRASNDLANHLGSKGYMQFRAFA